MIEFNHKPGSEPPDTPRSVLVFFVFDPHYRPEWGWTLASYKDGVWREDWDDDPLDYKPLFWADVPQPEMPPTYELMGAQ